MEPRDEEKWPTDTAPKEINFTIQCCIFRIIDFLVIVNTEASRKESAKMQLVKYWP
jgi:hypothetical protein